MSDKPRVRIEMVWLCKVPHHQHETYEVAEACIRAYASEHQVDPYAGVVITRPSIGMLLTVVHEAGLVQENGTQACARCGKQLLDAAPSTANRNLWGFAPGRRVAEGPRGFYLVAVDRQLAPGEVPCR